MSVAIYRILCAASATTLAGCATLSDEFYAQQSTPYLCEMANNPFSDTARAEVELVARHGDAWMSEVKATPTPHVGAHICTAIYRYGAPIDRNVTRWSGGSSSQWVFGYYPMGLLSSRKHEFYIYTDGGETISATQR